jgi:hypothetical protein
MLRAGSGGWLAVTLALRPPALGVWTVVAPAVLSAVNDSGWAGTLRSVARHILATMRCRWLVFRRPAVRMSQTRSS